MSSASTARSSREIKNLPLRRLLPKLFFDPNGALTEVGQVSQGEVVRLHLGLFRAYMFTAPEHVQHILRGNAANYIRGGMFWKPLDPLFGPSVFSRGHEWEVSRRALQSTFTARNVNSLAEYLAETIDEALDELARRAAKGPIDVAREMEHIVNKAVTRVFFGDKIPVSDVERLTHAIDLISPSVIPRYLMPFVPAWFPMPGDRRFRRGVRIFHEVIGPLVDRYRVPDDSPDLFSVIRRARDASGGELDDRWVRDNLIAMFAAGTESTSTALTWLWAHLRARPEVAERLCEEIDRVVGNDHPRVSHLPELTYTLQVVREVLRMNPVGWLISRVVMEPEELGGVLLKPGDTVLVSPYITHRLEILWDRPEVFDPDRFAPESAAGRHRWAYFPFGGGPHVCLGQHVFNIEAQLILAGILSRLRPVFGPATPVTPVLGASLRPRQEIRIEFRQVVRA